MNSDFRISVIVVTFNSEQHIIACLSSVYRQYHNPHEVIVVDNGSYDATTAILKRQYPQVVLIENQRNMGACRARNQGIERSSGDWIATIDCDVVLDKDFLYFITQALAHNSTDDIAVMQPKILHNDRKTIYSCGIYLSPCNRFFDIGKGKKDGPHFAITSYIYGATCAVAIYRRRALDQIKDKAGFFDERFFFLVEDVDVAWRLRKKGYRALYIPQAICYHEGNSSKASHHWRQYLCFRNRYLMIAKNETYIGRYRAFLFSLWYDAPRFVYLLFTNPFLCPGNHHTELHATCPRYKQGC